MLSLLKGSNPFVSAKKSMKNRHKSLIYNGFFIYHFPKLYSIHISINVSILDYSGL